MQVPSLPHQSVARKHDEGSGCVLFSTIWRLGHVHQLHLGRCVSWVNVSKRQVINNPLKAEEYLDLAEDIEDANAMKVASRDAAGRLVLLGAGQATDAAQEQVRDVLQLNCQVVA